MSTYIYGICLASKLSDAAHMVKPSDIYTGTGWVPVPRLHRMRTDTLGPPRHQRRSRAVGHPGDN